MFARRKITMNTGKNVSSNCVANDAIESHIAPFITGLKATGYALHELKRTQEAFDVSW